MYAQEVTEPRCSWPFADSKKMSFTIPGHYSDHRETSTISDSTSMGSLNSTVAVLLLSGWPLECDTQNPVLNLKLMKTGQNYDGGLWKPCTLELVNTVPG